MDQLNDKRQIVSNGLNALIAGNKDIKAMLFIGSFPQGAFDSFSDVDLFLFTDNPSRYMDWNDARWITPLGKVISRRVFRDRGDGVDKNKIILDNGMMYDFTLIPLKNFRIIRTYLTMQRRGWLFLLPGFLKRGINSSISKFYETIRRGCDIHYDAMGLQEIIGQLQERYGERPVVFPTQQSFANSYNNFWQSCYTASIKLMKGEYYHNLLLYDNYMKHQLLRAIEWQVITENASADTYYNGAKLEQWAGREMYEKVLPTLFHQDVLEMQYCLLRSAALYQELSTAIAAAYGFPLNKYFEDFVTDFITQTAIPRTERRLAKV